MSDERGKFAEALSYSTRRPRPAIEPEAIVELPVPAEGRDLATAEAPAAEPDFWDDEYDSFYFARHCPDAEMRGRVTHFLRETSGAEDAAKRFDAIQAGKIERYWILWCEFNEEAGHIVGSDTPNAVPITRLHT